MQVVPRNARRTVGNVEEGGADAVWKVPRYPGQGFTLYVDVGHQVGIGNAAIRVTQLQEISQTDEVDFGIATSQ